MTAGRVSMASGCDSGRVTRNSEGAAKLAVNPAGEVPASRTCPVATVVIPDGGEGDLSYEAPE